MNRMLLILAAILGIFSTYSGEAQAQSRLTDKKTDRRLTTVKEDQEILERIIEKINKNSALSEDDVNLIEELIKVQTCLSAPEPFVKAEDKAAIDKAIDLQKKILRTPGMLPEVREDHILDLRFLVALKLRARQYRATGMQVTPPSGP